MKSLIIVFVILFAAMTSFAESERPTVEPLMGVMTSWNGVYIQAHSSGCTSKKSFAVKTDREGDVTTVTFIRIEQDPCMAHYYFGKIFNFTFEELGLESGEKFIVTNPVVFSKAK